MKPASFLKGILQRKRRFVNGKERHKMKREDTKQVMIGGVSVGGGAPVRIQSMTNTKTEDIEATAAQILELEDAGCELVRCTVPTPEAAKALKEIKQRIHIPLIADIHFDYRLAVAAIENGADKIRINPGNIGSTDRVRAVADAANAYGVPIRIGVNGGSLEKDILEKYGHVTAEGLSESAVRNIELMESLGFDRLVVSIKSSDVPMCVRAHEILSESCPYPIHVGITEAGTLYGGTVRSAVGLGAILSQGIGDTIRVSLTAHPVEEIRAAKEILSALGLRKNGIRIVSCPTCGRTSIDLVTLAGEVEKLAASYPLDIKIAVMGCVVNGPGEGREADLGVCGGRGEGLIMKKGEVLRKVPEKELLNELKKELDAWEG